MSKAISTIVIALFLVAGCGGDDSSSSGGSSGSSDSYTCCINGSNYSCPNEASFNKCTPPSLDPSGCNHTGDSSDGMCH